METKITRAHASIDLAEFKSAIFSTPNLYLTREYCMYDEFTGKPIHCNGGDIAFILGEGSRIGYMQYMRGWIYLYNVPEHISKSLCKKLDAVFDDTIYYY